ncbi:MAG: type IV pilus twitching motility protein PilT [Candidatus Eutrophobiaceae bacterium]
MNAPFSIPENINEAGLRQLLEWAVEKQSSDILLCSGQRAHVRVHGAYQSLLGRTIPLWELANLVDNIYMPSASARLISGEDLDFSYEFRLNRQTRLRFRANAISTSANAHIGRGMALTLRAIPGTPPDPATLDLPEPLIDASRQNQGLIVICGATGSGKSTLLAGILAHTLQSKPGRYMASYESPIEFNLQMLPDMEGVIAQSEIPRDIPSFSHAVRNALRRAPDIILIGEARDRETISGVVRASQTGHLVYTTVHANGVANAIPRMVDEFHESDRHAISAKLIDSMRFALYQRLIPACAQGRLALREFLTFKPSLRRRLLQDRQAQQNLQAALQKALEEQGQSLHSAASQSCADGLIDAQQLRILEKEWGYV